MSYWNALNRVAFSHRWVDVGGLPTRLVEAGEGPETVVFLHGIGGHLETFCLNIAAHAQRYRVIAFDLLGHGYTAKPDGAYEIERYVEHTLRLFDVLGIERATLAGTSLGGWICARIAARHPEKVARLSLISSAGLTSHPAVMHKLKTLTERASLTSGKDAMRVRLEFVLKNPAALTEELVDIRHDIYSAPDYQRSVHNIMCLQDMQIRQRNLLTVEELGRIQAPTLVIWTRDDPTATLSDGRSYAAAIADSRFVVFGNSAHMPQLEEPERFNTLHMAFMAEPRSVSSDEAQDDAQSAHNNLTEKVQ